MMYYVLVILSVFAAACAQMLLKQGARKEYGSWWRQYINPWVIRWLWYHGMQSGAEYMVYEQGGAGKRGECDRVDELLVCTGAGIYAV